VESVVMQKLLREHAQELRIRVVNIVGSISSIGSL